MSNNDDIKTIAKILDDLPEELTYGTIISLLATVASSYSRRDIEKTREMLVEALFLTYKANPVRFSDTSATKH